jgi:hypothetical protein
MTLPSERELQGKHYKQFKYFTRGFKPEWYSPQNKEQSNAEALLALKKLLKELKATEADEFYLLIDSYAPAFHRFFYVTHLFRLDREFQKGDYVQAFNEVETLMHDCFFMQARIKDNLINVLERYLL